MKTQLTSLIRSLVSFVYTFLSSPQRIRLVLTVLVVCLILAALLLPSLITLAGPMGGGGS